MTANDLAGLIIIEIMRAELLHLQPGPRGDLLQNGVVFK